MKKSKFTDSQVMEALKRAEAGVAVPEMTKQRTARSWIITMCYCHFCRAG
jgi:hypothetical protein